MLDNGIWSVILQDFTSPWPSLFDFPCHSHQLIHANQVTCGAAWSTFPWPIIGQLLALFLTVLKKCRGHIPCDKHPCHQANTSTLIKYHWRYPINRWIDMSCPLQSLFQSASQNKTKSNRLHNTFFTSLLSKGSAFNQTNWLPPDLFCMTTVQKCLKQSWICTVSSKNRNASDCSLPNWLCNSVIVQCHQIDWIFKHALETLILWKMAKGLLM